MKCGLINFLSSRGLVKLKYSNTIGIQGVPVKKYYCKSWIKNNNEKLMKTDGNNQHINTKIILEELKFIKNQNEITKKLTEEQDNKIEKILKKIQNIENTQYI
jgi:hypothetical protein